MIAFIDDHRGVFGVGPIRVFSPLIAATVIIALNAGHDCKRSLSPTFPALP